MTKDDLMTIDDPYILFLLIKRHKELVDNELEAYLSKLFKEYRKEHRDDPWYNPDICYDPADAAHDLRSITREESKQRQKELEEKIERWAHEKFDFSEKNL